MVCLPSPPFLTPVAVPARGSALSTRPPETTRSGDNPTAWTDLSLYNSAMFRHHGGAKPAVMMATATLLLSTFPVLIEAQGDGPAGEPSATPSIAIKIKPNDVKHVELQPDGNAGFRYALTYGDGSTQNMTPEAYAALLYEDRSHRWFVFRLLNIHSTFGFAWVALGLIGQVLFAGRMVVQWIASERHQRSLVPVQFWWMSLGGASMLLVYFIWRRDIVGILGQSVGWIIYVRNLYFIYRPAPP